MSIQECVRMNQMISSVICSPVIVKDYVSLDDYKDLRISIKVVYLLHNGFIIEMSSASE